MANSNIEIHKIKTKSEKEILKAITSAKKDVKKTEDTSFVRLIKARESLRAHSNVCGNSIEVAVWQLSQARRIQLWSCEHVDDH